MNTVAEKGHLALYRKYRPQAFDSLIGQGHIKKTLENAIANQKVSHAYLLTGPRGTGKTTTAKLVAKAINCEQPNGVEPCGQCESCSAGNLDIREIDAASNNGVDDIRELRQDVQMAPLNSKYKVYIIDECHMLTTQAFNALLKTLEEPPKHVIFILATTEVHKVPTTIISRCQRYDFKRITQLDIKDRLTYVCQQEGVQAEPNALQLISQVAAGGMRDALSLLDQAIAKANSAQTIVTLQDVLDLTGAVDVSKIGHLLSLIASKQTEQAIQFFNECYYAGNEPKFFIEEMMIYIRDILVFSKLGAQANLKKAQTDSRFEEVAQQVLNTNEIYSYLNVLQDTLNQAKFHHDLQLLLEMMIIKLTINVENDLQSQINELRKMIQSGVQVSSVNMPIQENSVHSADNAIHQPETKSAEDLLAGAETLVTEQVGILPADKENMEIGQAEDLLDGVENMVTVLEEKTFIGVDNTMPQEPPVNVTEINEPPLEPADELDIADSQINNFINDAMNGDQDWPDIAGHYTEHAVDPNPIPPNEQPLDENNGLTTIEPTSPEQLFGEEEVSGNSNILLDEKELAVLDALLTAVKEQREAFNEKYSEIAQEALKVSKSTGALFREFEVKAVNETSVVVMHNERAKVKLLEKVKNRSLIESVLTDVLKSPMKLFAVSKTEWENCTSVYRKTRNNK